MKKILSLLGTITLIGTNTTSLVACNTSQYTYSEKELAELKEEKNINIKTSNGEDGILEWIASQEKPFNKVDDKWYYVIWRGDEKDSWKIVRFYNDNFKTINKFNNFELQVLSPKNKVIYGLLISEKQKWGYKPIKRWIDDKNNNHFKAVYRWNSEEQNLPDLIIDNKGNIKVKD